jgi:hypothetical protein
MDAAKTIGDLISDALRSSSIMEEAERAFQEEADAEQDRLVLVGRCLARDLAGNYHLQFDEVWDALCHIPNHMLGMLATPYGWTVIGEYIAAGLNLSGSEPLIPTVH